MKPESATTTKSSIPKRGLKSSMTGIKIVYGRHPAHGVA